MSASDPVSELIKLIIYDILLFYYINIFCLDKKILINI